jgi:hypothetical protein
MVSVSSSMSTEELVNKLSRVLRRNGHGGAWGGSAGLPRSDRRSLGALLHVEATSVGQAAEGAVELMRAAYDEAGIPFDELDEVTISAPMLAPTALQRN